MNESNALVILQTICITASACMALMLGLSRIHITNKNSNYETSRWLLFTSMVIAMIHYWLQIHFGLRAMGDDVGALVNILFYTPVCYCISYATIRMVCGKIYTKRYFLVSVTSIAIILALFVIGWLNYHSLHMQHALYCMGGVFFLTMMYYIVTPVHEIGRRMRKVENETGGDIQNFILYMKVGSKIMFALSALLPLVIFSKYMLAVYGPLFFITLFFYILCFVVMGFNTTPIEVLEDEPTKDEEEEDKFAIDEETMLAIDEKIDQWVETREYCNPELTISMLARKIGVKKKILTQYLSKRKNATFRVWISDLRIEEVKRMILEHDKYSNETIAAECGFSSRSWMQQRFKAVTGMTPMEWKDENKE